MKTYLVSKSFSNFLLFAILIISSNPNAIAFTARANSGNFMLVKTPDDSKTSDFVLVEKSNGKQSLIEIAAETGNETILSRSKGEK